MIVIMNQIKKENLLRKKNLNKIIWKSKKNWKKLAQKYRFKLTVPLWLKSIQAYSNIKSMIVFDQ